jgi:hypothetical protein
VQRPPDLIGWIRRRFAAAHINRCRSKVHAMRTNLLTYLGDSRGGGSPVDAYVRDLRAARDQGFDFAWTVQLPWEHDALITLAVALREVDGIRVGTGVQPNQTRGASDQMHQLGFEIPNQLGGGSRVILA